MASIHTFLELSNALDAARALNDYRSKAYAESRQDFEKWLQTHHCIKTMHKLKYYDLERYGYYVYVQDVPIDPHTVQFIDVKTFDRCCEVFRSEVAFFREQSGIAFDKFRKAEKEFMAYLKSLSKEEFRELMKDLWQKDAHLRCA